MHAWKSDSSHFWNLFGVKSWTDKSSLLSQTASQYQLMNIFIFSLISNPESTLLSSFSSPSIWFTLASNHPSLQPCIYISFYSQDLGVLQRRRGVKFSFTRLKWEKGLPSGVLWMVDKWLIWRRREPMDTVMKKEKDRERQGEVIQGWMGNWMIRV